MKKFITGSALLMLLFSACQKKTDPVDGSNATVTLNGGGTNYVTGNLTVNPKDTLVFSFNISSDEDMKYVSIQKNPVNQTAFVVRDTLTAATKNSYTALKKIVADTANGDFVYRIVAHDAGGNYIGHKDVVITVKPDFSYYTYRFLRVPDTTDKINTCYMATSTGTLYSYSSVGTNSGLIDFGVMYDTTGAGTASTTDDLKFCLYALSAAQPQIPFYDISSWTKNATIMKKATSPAFNTLLSAGGLRSAAVTNLASGTSNKVTQLVAGNLVFFKTAAGKAGCLQVGFVNDVGTAKGSYINVDVKIEK